MTKRWNKSISEDMEHPSADQFIEAYINLCRHHGLIFGHEDTQGAFIVQPYDDDTEKWARNAMVGKGVEAASE